MRHPAFSLCLAMVVLFGMAAASAADGGGAGGLIERLSGPGPWPYFSAYIRTCLDPTRGAPDPTTGKRPRICDATEDDVWLSGSFFYAFTGSEDRVDLQSPFLNQFGPEAAIDFKVTDLSGTVPLLLGVGAGGHWFRGDSVSLERYSIEFPRITVIFAGEPTDSRYVGFRYGLKFFPQGFTAADFGDPVGTYSTGGTEFVQSFAVFIKLW